MTAEFRPATVLVTGGAGFIGSNLVRWLLRTERDVAVIVLDALTYAGNLESLADVFAAHGPTGDARLFFVRGDIRDAPLAATMMRGGGTETETSRRLPPVDAVLHLAAESHVDRSILGPAEFVATNVQGTLNLLEATRQELKDRPREFRFVDVSTDEVYGSLGSNDPAFTELTPLAPNSPYSASKAGADCLVRAYGETFHLPVLTTRCSNNYGPFQFPEKLIPLMITRALQDQPLPVYGDGRNVRDWLFVDDHAEAIWRVCLAGVPGRVYNIGGNAERHNIDVVTLILEALGKPRSLIQYVTDRPGHDRRYAMDITTINRQLGWAPRVTFEKGLEQTVGWYLNNRAWWERVRSQAYRATRSLYMRTEVG
jgi:dTDP-glucose 4,6-dehydratase